MTLVELISRADKNTEVALFDKDKKDIGSYKIPFIPQEFLLERVSNYYIKYNKLMVVIK